MKKALIITASALFLTFSTLSPVCADNQSQEVNLEEQEMFDYYETLLSSALDLSQYEPQSDSLKGDFKASEPILDIEILGNDSTESKKLSIGMTYDEVISVLGNDYATYAEFENQVIKPGLGVTGEYKSSDGKILNLFFANKVREDCLVKDSFLCGIWNNNSKGPSMAVNLKIGSISAGSSFSDVMESYSNPGTIGIDTEFDRSDGTQKMVYYLKLKYNWKSDKQIGDFTFNLDHDKVVYMGIGASINED